MNEIKFSILVACYNVEQYIKECVESVLIQTHSNWELILVDDSSEDGTYKIIKEYSERDERIRAFTKEHRGLPHTRNYGMQYMTGDYFLVLDGDDFFAKNHLMRLNNIISHSYADMIIGNQHTYFTKDTKQPIIFFPEISGTLSQEDKLEMIFSLYNELPATAFLTAYNRRFCMENGLRYTEKYQCSEDLDFFLNAISKNPKTEFTYYEFYFYRRDNMNSMTRNLTGEMLLDRLSIYVKWFHYYMGKTIGDFSGSNVQAKLSQDICNQLYVFYSLKARYKEKKNIWRFIHSNKEVFYYQGGHYAFVRGYWAFVKRVFWERVSILKQKLL